MWFIEDMATHPSVLAWRIPGAGEPGGLPSMGSHRVGHDWVTSLSFSLSCIGGGNGNPLQCPCLENPRDGGAWWAAVYGVTQGRTRLKRLSSSSSSIAVRAKLMWILMHLKGSQALCLHAFSRSHKAIHHPSLTSQCLKQRDYNGFSKYRICI